jgi:2-polyprenyl-3-methyl-5-hydroxy-6-metoxy-1,4-benzoquinol methylase
MLDTKQITDERTLMILQEIDEGKSILDLGCVDHSYLNEQSPDWLHKYLYQKSKDVLGVDFEKSDVEILQKKGYNIIFGDVETMDLKRKFDIIIAGQLVPSLSNPGLFLDNVYKHLNDDGKLILTTANAWAFYRCVYAFFGRNKLSAQHTALNDYDTISQLLRRHNFEIAKFDYILYPRRRKIGYEWPNREEFAQYREYAAKNKSSSSKTLAASLCRQLSIFFYKVGMKQVAGDGLFFVCKKAK